MPVMIVNLPNVYTEDDYQMPPTEWLELIRLRGELNTHGDKSSDGYRVHYAKTGSDCACGQATCPKINALAKKVETESEYLFSFNRQFLIEALAGIESPEGYVHLFRTSVGKASSSDGQKFENPMVLVLSDGETRLAVIMPLGTVHPSVLAPSPQAEA